jgi:glycosyltransferase involved in cell wall biosynthesis
MRTQNINNRPLISVVMAAHNAERYISQSIQSVLSQTYTHLELIIYDDGSLDSTAAIVAAFADERIQLIRGRVNNGVSVARNKCIEVSRGAYIAILDADDIWDARKLQMQLDFIDKNKEVCIVGTSVYEIDEAGHVIGKRDYPQLHSGIASKKLWECPFLHSSVLFRSSLGLRYREDVTQAEDWELFDRILVLGQGANLGNRLVYYRVHPANLTNSKSQEQVKEAFKVVRCFEELRFLNNRDVDLFYCVFSYNLRGINRPLAALTLLIKINIITSFNQYSRKRLRWVISYAVRYWFCRKPISR